MDAARQVSAAVGGFLFASLGWMVVVGVLTNALVVASGQASGASLDAISADPTSFLTPGIMGASAFVQSVGIGVIAVLLARQLADEDGVEPRHALLGDPPGWWGWSVAGAAGALSVGLLPGWVASQIIARFPELGGALAVLAGAMQTEAPLGKALLVLAICGSAPLFEELAFRGYLWHHLAKVLPGWAVWLATSVLFVGYHLDPVQTPSLVPTALFLGWLRWQSGSIVPAIVGHFVNNALASVGLLLASGSDAPEISFASACLGTLATILSCGAAWLARPRT
ncbi:MAG: CPBP family intramembrane metalloprotease [Alphaproteobacteria bacterium]|nr:CPBP family intramembrane metalloprotease [Alphaproteobacteria bacterium]